MMLPNLSDTLADRCPLLGEAACSGQSTDIQDGQTKGAEKGARRTPVVEKPLERRQQGPDGQHPQRDELSKGPLNSAYSTWAFALHLSLFTTLPQEQFINTLERVILKQSKYTVTIDEGWYTEAELRDELGWSACLVRFIC